MPEEILDIVNEADEVIGQAPRNQAHHEGLRHREVGVWFFTPSGEIVFQRRSPTKETSPNKLATTVAGHVPTGESYDDAALRELYEETGLRLRLSDLKRLAKQETRHVYAATGLINHAFKQYYAYRYTDDVVDLYIEPGEATGYELWPIDTILSLHEDDRTKFISDVSSPQMQELFRQMKSIL